jgi:hypothetical protein
MIRLSLWARLTLIVGGYLAMFTVVASLIFLKGSGLIGYFDWPVWQWWEYAWELHGNPVVRSWLVVSGVPAAVLPLFVVGGIVYRTRHIIDTSGTVRNRYRSLSDSHSRARKCRATNRIRCEIALPSGASGWLR